MGLTLNLQPKEHLVIVSVQNFNNWPIPGIPCYALALKTCKFKRLIGSFMLKRITPLLNNNNNYNRKKILRYAHA